MRKKKPDYKSDKFRLCPHLAERHQLTNLAANFCWNSIPPAGVPYHLHKLSIMDGVEWASATLRNDPGKCRERLVIGTAHKIWYCTLPAFEPEKKDALGYLPMGQGGFTILGKIGYRDVLYDPNRDAEEYSLLITDKGEGVLLTVSNSHL